MRKVVASFFISLDGVVEAPQTWQFPYMDAEAGAVIGEALAATDAFLLGRRTYEEWAAFWPHQDAGDPGMARAINTTPKYVVSRSLETVEWENSTLLKGDLAEEVARLKAEPGGQIAVNGSATLVRSLLRAGVLDELRLMLHPVVVGRGARLFEDPSEHRFELVESGALASGVLNLTYRPAA
jgi:dihydrofolate reductase